METRELSHILAAVLLMFVAFGLEEVLVGNPEDLLKIFVFSFIVIFVPVLIKKGSAYLFDANVEHEIWMFSRFGYKPQWRFKKPLPFGLIVPLLFSIISFGILKVTTFLTYEARALKHRAAKRFGPYSYTSMTDWHNGLIGAAGVISLMLVAIISYFSEFELLTIMSSYYAFWNMIPFSKLDGTQIFFGNKVLWAVLAFIAMLFGLFALLIL